MIAESIDELLEFVFQKQQTDFADCAVLAPRNTFVDLINEKMMMSLPGDTATYLATDSAQNFDSQFKLNTSISNPK